MSSEFHTHMIQGTSTNLLLSIRRVR